MRCIVVDDEMPARDEIVYLLKEIGEVDVIGEASDGKGALKLIKNEKPDVVFLDINMSGMDGFQILNETLKEKIYPYFVFVTAYDQYAIRAFEVNALDYLLKPIDKNRLQNTVNRLREILINKEKSLKIENKLKKFINGINNKKINKVCVYDNGKYIPLSPEEILFITTDGRQTIIRSKAGEFTSNLTLAELEDKLNKHNFFRSHRSYLMNLDEVKEIHNWFNGTFQVVLNGVDDIKVSVSRNRANEFKNIMDI